MTLLVKEQKALEKLEDSLIAYYGVMLGEQIEIDRTKTVEERLLFLSEHINALL